MFYNRILQEAAKVHDNNNDDDEDDVSPFSFSFIYDEVYLCHVVFCLDSCTVLAYLYV